VDGAESPKQKAKLNGLLNCKGLLARYSHTGVQKDYSGLGNHLVVGSLI